MRKKEYQKDLSALLQENKQLVETTKNLEFDLRTAQRQMETETSTAKIREQLNKNNGSLLSSNRDEYDYDENKDEPEFKIAPAPNPVELRNNSSEPERDQFVVVQSYSEDDMARTLQEDIEDTEPLLTGSLLQAVDDDDFTEDMDETLLKTLGNDEDFTQDVWRRHRRERSQAFESKQKHKIADMLARAQSIKTRATAMSSKASHAGSVGPSSPRDRHESIDSYHNDASMAEVLEAVNVVREDLIKETKTIHNTLLNQLEKKNHELQYKNVELSSQLEIYFKMLTDERKKREDQMEEMHKKLEDERLKVEKRVDKERQEVLKERDRNKTLENRIEELEQKRRHEEESHEKRKEHYESKIQELKDAAEEKDELLKTLTMQVASRDLEVSEANRGYERELALKDSHIAEITQKKLETVLNMQRELDKTRNELSQIAIFQQTQNNKGLIEYILEQTGI